MEKTGKKRFILNYIAIVAIFSFAGAGGWLKPAVQVCIDAWPDVPEASIRSLVTLPQLISMVVMLCVGTIVGTKIRYKTCMLIGSACVVIGGALPFFYSPSWTFVMVCRGLIGVGVGFFGPRNALLMKSVPQKKRAAYLGFASLGLNIVYITIYPMVGYLANISWKHPFLVNFMQLLIFIIVMFLLHEPEDEIVDNNELASEAIADKKNVSEEPKDKAKIPSTIIIYFVIIFLATAVKYPILSSMSSYVINKGIGTSVLAGTLLSFYTIGGAVSNTLLAAMHKYLKQYVLFFVLALCALGSFLILFVSNTVGLFAGITLSGVGFYALLASLHLFIGKIASAKSIGRFSTFLTGFNLLGVYMSSYYIDLAGKVFNWHNAVESSFLGCMFYFIIVAVLALVFRNKLVPKDN